MRFKSILFIAAAALFISHLAPAEITALVNYQGKLKKNGQSVNGPVNVTFKVFTGETNSECIYTESQQVTVKEGLYSTLLGKSPSQGNIEDATMLDEAYLEVTVEGTPLKPREKFTPPGFSKKSTQRLNYFTRVWPDLGPGTTGLGYQGFTHQPMDTDPALTNGEDRTLQQLGEWLQNRNWLQSLYYPPMNESVQIKSVRILLLDYWAASSSPVPQLTNVTVVLKLSATDALSGSSRVICFDRLSITNESSLHNWIPINLSTNRTDLLMNSTEQLSLFFVAYSAEAIPSVSYIFHSSFWLDVRVR